MHHCCICQRPLFVNHSAWLCRDCRETYELSGAFAFWPEWAKECKRLEQNDRRRLAIVDAVEIPFCELGVDIAEIEPLSLFRN
jgi:hypothetical protein